jgi:hypothetical protein
LLLIIEETVHPPAAIITAFHFVHIWIFVVAMFFIVHAVRSLILSLARFVARECWSSCLRMCACVRACLRCSACVCMRPLG